MTTNMQIDLPAAEAMSDHTDKEESAAHRFAEFQSGEAGGRLSEIARGDSFYHSELAVNSPIDGTCAGADATQLLRQSLQNSDLPIFSKTDDARQAANERARGGGVAVSPDASFANIKTAIETCAAPKTCLAALVFASVLAAAFVWASARAIAYPAAVAAQRSQENFPLSDEVIANQFLNGQKGDETSLRATIAAAQGRIAALQSYAFAARPTLNRPRGNPFGLAAPGAAADPGAALLQAVNQMRLQSITIARRNACVIDRNIYHEQDTIGQFTIDQITPTVVILRTGPYRFELPLQQ